VLKVAASASEGEVRLLRPVDWHFMMTSAHSLCRLLRAYCSGVAIPSDLHDKLQMHKEVEMKMGSAEMLAKDE